MSIVPDGVAIQDFIEPYITFDEPIPCGILKIYPVRMKDSFKFLSSCDILAIKKNAVSDVKIIQMSYLEFIFNLCLAEKAWRDKLLNILKVCLHVEKDKEFIATDFPEDEMLSLKIDNGTLFFFNGYNIKIIAKDNDKIELKIKDTIISPKDFEEIRRLIMYQNILNYDDAYIDPDVQKVKDEYFRLKNKSITQPNIETQMAIISSENGMSKAQMLEITYREFTLLFNTIVEKIDYQINKRADLQNKEFEKPVPHWIFEKNQNKLDGVLMAKGDFDAKMQNVT